MRRPDMSNFAKRNALKICVVQFVVIWFLVLTLLYLHLSGDIFWMSERMTSCSTEGAYDRSLSMMRSEIGQLRLLLGKTQDSIALSSSTLMQSVASDISTATVYVVTPTHARLTQKADLIRMSQTLLLVPRLHWIVVEDGHVKSELVERLLAWSGVKHTHLSEATPREYKLKSAEPNWLKARGVHQRNAALAWLRRHRGENKPDADRSVVYFADDDNTYDVQLFEEMRSTNIVSVWPVGLVGGLKWEGPKVQNGKVVGWVSAWKPERLFAIDMAAFAVKLQLLLDRPEATFSAESPIGYVETNFLKTLTTPEEMEPKAGNCTKVLVWHTRTEKYNAHLQTKINMQNLQYISEINMEV